MKNKESFIVTLIVIYLALVFLIGIAVYALIIHFKLEVTLATNILIWTATLFATIALLYTFNTWRDQKGSEVLSKLSENMFFDMTNIFEINKNIIDEHREIILSKLLKNIDISINDIDTIQTKKLDDMIKNLLHNGYLIYKYTQDEKFKKNMIEFHDAYIEYQVFRKEIYLGMKTIERTEYSSKSIAIDKDNKDEYLDHQNKLTDLGVNLNKTGSKLSENLLIYIFHNNKKI